MYSVHVHCSRLPENQKKHKHGFCQIMFYIKFACILQAIAKVMDIPESSVAILSKNSTNILQVINDQYLVCSRTHSWVSTNCKSFYFLLQKAIGLIKFSVPAVNGVNITVQPIMGCNRYCTALHVHVHVLLKVYFIHTWVHNEVIQYKDNSYTLLYHAFARHLNAI